MAWVKFWCKSNRGADEQYLWYDDVSSFNVMDDKAYDWAVERWHYHVGSYTSSYGFVLLDKLPDKVKDKLLHFYVDQKDQAEKMISNILHVTL